MLGQAAPIGKIFKKVSTIFTTIIKSPVYHWRKPILIKINYTLLIDCLTKNTYSGH